MLDLAVSPGTNFSTGKIARFYSGSSNTGTKNLVEMINDNTLATGTTVLTLQQDAASNSLVLDHNGTTGVALYIDTEATSSSIYITSPGTSNGTGVVTVISANSLTSGAAGSFHSFSADTSTRSLVAIFNDNALATGTTALNVRQDAAQRALFVDQNANGNALNIDSESTTTNVIEVATVSTTADTLAITAVNALTSGNIVDLRSNSASTTARSLMYLANSNSLAVNAIPFTVNQSSDAELMQLQKSTTDGGFINYAATADADTTSAISTLTTSGATTHHIQVEINGTKAWIAVSTTNPS
jgi:hypothetical protein